MATTIGMLYTMEMNGHSTSCKAERERLIRMMWNDEYPVHIQMPCGESKTYHSATFIPVEDVKCSCGDPEHFFVKYEIK